MKRYYIGLLSLLLASALPAQNTVKMSAVKSNDYGVGYTLPKTTITVKADATKTVRKAGEFYEYAERYLNISNPVTEDETVYTITAIKAIIGGIPDKEKSYLVEFKSGTTAPYVTLTKDGLICAINADAQLSPADDTADATAEKSKPLPNPNSFLSEETLRAGSKARQAELISKQIFQLRETRNNILTGEADNMPPDGAAYTQVLERIDIQEKALTSMFIGTENVENVSKTFTIIPTKDNINDQIVFRFSTKLGFVNSNDMAGAPVTLTLVNKEPAAAEPAILSPKDQKAWDEKFAKGIIYNIPAKADLQVKFANKTWVDKDIDVVQYGKLEVLIPKMFEDNKQPVKVIFFPEMGAIKQIIQ